MNPKSILAFGALAFSLLSCSKSVNSIVLSTDLTVVNMGVGLEAIKVGTGDTTDFTTVSAISYTTNKLYPFPRNTISLQVIDTANPSVTFYNDNATFNSGIYSLFIVGDSSNPEGLLVEETPTIPYINSTGTVPAEDQVVNVRFANFSPNSTALKITQTSPTIGDSVKVTNLNFKDITDWVSYDAQGASVSYTFNIWDAVADTVIFTYTLPATSNRYKAVTLMIKGFQGNRTANHPNIFGVVPFTYF